MTPELILASRSPQRRAILEQLGVSFRVEAPDVEELAEGDPRAVVVENARRKAAAIARRHGLAPPEAGPPDAGAPQPAPPGAGAPAARAPEAAPPRILAADTEVALGGRVYGKARDAAEAERFLGELSGAEHEVVGGIVVRDAAGERSAVAVTRVRFRSLSDAQVAWYVAGGEWRGRAGGYAIQGRGAALVERIEGDYWNVVGLPVPALIALVPDLL